MPAQAQAASRRDKRVNLDTRVHVRGPDGRETLLLSVDWTPRSVFLRTREPFSPGTHVDMFVVIGQPVRRINLGGLVTRVVPHMPGALHVREGMVVTFDSTQTQLQDLIDEAVRARRGAEITMPAGLELPAPVASVAPAALVIGADATAHAVAQVLLTQGYDVTRLDQAPPAIRDPVTGSAPWLLVVCEGSPHVIARIVSGGKQPELVVAFGVPVRDLGAGIEAPLMALPRTWPVARLPDAIKNFLPSTPREPPVVRTPDEGHVSWFQGPIEPPRKGATPSRPAQRAVS